MLGKIDEIQEKGLELSEAVSKDLLASALDPKAGFKVVAPGKLAVRFKKVSGRVFLTGALDPALSCPCKRCLKEVALPLPVTFSLRMVDEREVERSEHVEPATRANKRPEPQTNDGKLQDIPEREL